MWLYVFFKMVNTLLLMSLLKEKGMKKDTIKKKIRNITNL